MFIDHNNFLCGPYTEANVFLVLGKQRPKFFSQHKMMMMITLTFCDVRNQTR